MDVYTKLYKLIKELNEFKNTQNSLPKFSTIFPKNHDDKLIIFYYHKHSRAQKKNIIETIIFI